VDLLKQLHIEPNPSATYCGGHGWISSNGKTIPCINPATEAQITQVQTCSAEQYELVMQNSAAEFQRWRHLPAPKRGELIRAIGDKLRQYKDPLGSLIATEMGKIKQEGDGEVQEMIDIADLAVGQSRMLYGKTMHSERPQHRMYEQWHPLGIVGVISAFNFPMAVWSWNAFLAAIAGNTVVWKPSSKTPLCAVAVQHICNQVMEVAGYPGVFSLFLPEDRSTSERFIHDPRVGLMSFTGSSATGHKVAAAVSARMGKYLLECSGNNAIIVDQSADLKLVIPAIVFGAAGTAGQRCTTTRRVLVHHSIMDEVCEKLRHAYAQIKPGNPLQTDVLMGPLIDATAVDRFVQVIETLKNDGAQILAGGKSLPGPGYFVEPTLVRMEEQKDMVKQETFAPILYLMPYDTLEHAIALQNDVPQGLSSAIFTQDLKTAETFLSVVGSDCGIANVNIGTSGAEIGGAFGGEKQTGGGREAGSDSWKAYMRRQTNTINWSDELPLAQGIRFDLE